MKCLVNDLLGQPCLGREKLMQEDHREKKKKVDSIHEANTSV